MEVTSTAAKAIHMTVLPFRKYQMRKNRKIMKRRRRSGDSYAIRLGIVEVNARKIYHRHQEESKALFITKDKSSEEESNGGQSYESEDDKKVDRGTIQE